MPEHAVLHGGTAANSLTRFESWPALTFAGQTSEEFRLARRVEEALREHEHRCLRLVDVAVKDGIVMLRGLVPSFYLKQLAQTVVLSIPGVQCIRNDLEVRASAT